MTGTAKRLARVVSMVSVCALSSLATAGAHGAEESRSPISDERGLLTLVEGLLGSAQGLERIADADQRRAAKAAFAAELGLARSAIKPVRDLLESPGPEGRRSLSARSAIQLAEELLYPQRVVASRRLPMRERGPQLDTTSLARSVGQLIKAKAFLTPSSTGAGSFDREGNAWLLEAPRVRPAVQARPRAQAPRPTRK